MLLLQEYDTKYAARQQRTRKRANEAESMRAMRVKLEEKEREAAMAAAAALVRRQQRPQSDADKLTALRMDGVRLQQRVADSMRAAKQAAMERSRSTPGRGGTVRVSWTHGTYTEAQLSTLLTSYGGCTPSLVLHANKSMAIAEYAPPGDAQLAVTRAAAGGVLAVTIIKYSE